MSADLKRIGKFLSLILRHDPDKIGLELDAQGWAKIDDLLGKMPGRYGLTHDILTELVATNEKQRYAFSEDGKRVRANQGHSIPIDLGLTPEEPPQTLYHGTATRFVESILKEGLKPGSRQYVHLSLDKETAIKVGQRHGKPTIFTIPARQMHKDGKVFYRAENGVWLTDHVPANDLHRL